MSTQKAIQVNEWQKDSLEGARIEHLQIPQLEQGEALVKITLRPVNPTDLITLHGFRASMLQLPVVPGSEGVGIIEQPAAGSSKFSRGQRVVAIWSSATRAGRGTWQQYVAAKEDFLVPVPDNVPDHVAAQFYVNPVTAYGLVEELAAPKGEWIIQTAAGSVLGRMLIALAKRKGVCTINVVRRSSQKKELLKLGADEVIATDKEDLKVRVKEITGGKGAWGAVDAVAGELSFQLMSCIRPSGKVYVYGALSGIKAEANVMELLAGKTLTGFMLYSWLGSLGREGQYAACLDVLKLLEQKVIQPLTGEIYKLDDFKKAITASTEVGHGGKILLES